MKRFRHPLLVIDGHSGDQAAVVRAVSLAASNAAPLTLLSDAGLSGDPARHDAVHARVDRIARIASRAGVALSVRLTPCATSTAAILEHVRSGAHDILIKAGQGGAAGGVLSERDRELVRCCPVPVWALPRHAADSLLRVLVALGPLQGPARDLTVETLRIATALAITEGCELDVVHACSPAEPGDLETRLRRAAVCELVRRIVPPEVAPEVFVSEQPAETLVAETLGRRTYDLVVLGTRSRRSRRQRFGTTAGALLEQLDCGMLAVTPEVVRTFARLDDEEEISLQG